MKWILTSRWIHTLFLLALLSGALLVRQYDAPWLKGFGYQAFDAYNRITPRPTTDQVVIVDIDEASLRDDRLGQWPWPRTVMAQLVTNLKAAGAKAIVFDMVFSEKDRTSPTALLSQMPEGSLSAEAKGELTALPDHDDQLAAAFKEAGNVVTGFVSSGSVHTAGHTPRVPRNIQFMKGTDPLKTRMATVRAPVTTLPELEAAAAGNGFFSTEPDYDGIIRSAALLQRLDAVQPGEPPSYYAMLALEGLRIAETDNSSLAVRPIKNKDASVFSPNFEIAIDKKYRIPIDDDGKFYVHFTPARPDQYIPAWRVVDNSVESYKIKDKIVLVGTSAIGLKDIRSSPLNLFVPGVEIHLNIIEQILQGRFLSRPNSIIGIETIFILFVGLMIILLAPFINAVLLSVFTALTMLGIGGMSYWLFDTRGLLLDPVFPSLTVFFLFVSAVMLTYIRTEIERRTVRHAFGLYISPDYMKDLTENPDQLRLGGEIRDISVMFTDIRGFTGISEQLKPDELIQLMNDFLTPMSDMVMSNRGTIDKYMGDAMMAFWNAPIEDPEHPRHACIAALAMNDALTPINARLVQQAEAAGKAPLQLKAGIGINSGPGAVGNMGSRQRFAYSVLGDTVNLASRLESQTKAYGVDILIGETTANAVRDFAVLELDLMRVKGKLQPARIFTLLGGHEAAMDSEFHVLRLAHDEMLKLYRDGQFDLAQERIIDCLAHAPANIAGYYTMMRERMDALKKTPPAADWDGVFIATSK